MTERTLSIVKPDAVRNGNIGDVMKTFEENNLKVVAARLEQLTLEKAREFYAVHSERPFYNDLVNFMISGPIFVSVLEGENAILKNRELMG
ncbi:MAG: nucleoside-diphosphate kinase, partial [Myxococcota bacterium]|nr:nucleoside-diphosphate kinase [Myxococcota bacterium]